MKADEFEAKFSQLGAALLELRNVRTGASSDFAKANASIEQVTAQLRAENQRRQAAGVKVSASGDSFDARHIKMLQSVVDILNDRATLLAKMQGAADSVAGEALALVAEMGAQIRATERTAAEREAADASDPLPLRWGGRS